MNLILETQLSLGAGTTNFSSLSLSDVLIIRNWIDYAKGIGDPSAQLLDQNGAKSHTQFIALLNLAEAGPIGCLTTSKVCFLQNLI